MSVWRYPISWSKFKLALDCPSALERTINKEPPSEVGTNYYQELGTTVQFCFEQYFNQEVNLKPGGARPEVMKRVTEKILNSKWFIDRTIQYPFGKTEEGFKEKIRDQTVRGWDTFNRLGLLKKKIRSEVKWNAVFRGMRMFGMIDFVVEGGKGTFIFDGKGHEEKNADPRQLLYYGLMVVASHKTLAGGGFLYWQHDYERVDLSPEAIKKFVDGPFTEGKKIIDRLVVGVENLETRPSEKCRWCSWKRTCPDSTEKRPEVTHGLPDQITLGEV